jgi:hypothetical protein
MKVLQSRRSQIPSFLDFFIPAVGWFPVLVFLIYSIKIRIHDKYLSSLLIVSGRDDLSLSFPDVLFIFREDLIYFGVLMPIAIAVLWRCFNRRLALLASATLVILSCTILYANLQSWGQVGRFLTASALVDAVSFAASKPSVIGDYISIRGLAKYIVVVVLCMIYYLYSSKLAAHRRLSRCLGLLGTAGVAACLAGGIIGYQSNLRGNNISSSFLLNAVKSLLPQSEPDNQYVHWSDQKIIAEFDRLSKKTGDASGLENFGAERKSNLLLFILETGSIEFLDTRKELFQHPVWKMLPKSQYISANHFSTFPASAESNLSLLTGLYPPRAYYDTCLVGLSGKDSIPTLLSQLHDGGAKTAVYAPFASQVPMDKVVFERTGFEKIFYGAQHPDPATGNADDVALREMISDIKQWGDAKQQFAVGFYPQIGHGPWQGALGEPIAERGHKLILKQLDWLARVVEQLARSGVLEDTVIVITGDHGVRTTQEDPDLKAGMIDKYSLQVPLIVVAPHSHYPAAVSTRPTSHVDVPAELSLLFGMQRGRIIQGVPFFDKSIDTRRQFFMANWYYGADGYRDSGQSAMYSTVLEAAFSRADGIVSFKPADIVVNQGKADGIRHTELQILDLQFEWVRRFACGGHQKA